MNFVEFSIPLVFLIIVGLFAQGLHAAPGRHRYKQRVGKTQQTYDNSATINNNNVRPVRSEFGGKQVYLLVSTSSKLYCMRLPDTVSEQHRASNSGVLKRGTAYYTASDLHNYEIIYEEKANPNCWITDALYVKSEQLIYVNVYNSSSASSDIFTLKYDPIANMWIKTVLYKDQSFCLGLSYNEVKKELYWTAAKTIVAGSSIAPLDDSAPRNTRRILFNLDSAKKLLYLKYDPLTDTIFVSTLNYVYACSMRQVDRSDCKIIMRDLVSTRGLYLDIESRFLYAVDHKKRNIKRVRLPTNPLVDYHSDNYDDSVDTVLSTEVISDIGDTFYMTMYKNMLIWCEFSGKVKLTHMNNTSQYSTVFATNEYTYSVNIMDNVTLSGNETTTTGFFSSSEETSTLAVAIAATTDMSTSTSVPISSVERMELSSSGELTSTSDNSAQISIEVIDSLERHMDTTEPPLVAWTRNRITTTVPIETMSESPSVTTIDQTTESLTSEDTTSSSSSFEVIVSTTARAYSEESVEVIEDSKSIIQMAATSVLPFTSFNQDTISESTTSAQSENNVSEEPATFFQRNASSLALNQEYDEDEAHHLPKNVSSFNQVHNLRSMSLLKSNASETLVMHEASSSGLNLPRSTSTVGASPKHSVALYIVIALLCFSLIVNIVLLYVSKRTQMNREKLIIRHEICDTKSESSTPSQRSGINSHSGELHDCNINLINSSNDSATSALDIEQ